MFIVAKLIAQWLENFCTFDSLSKMKWNGSTECCLCYVSVNSFFKGESFINVEFALYFVAREHLYFWNYILHKHGSD